MTISASMDEQAPPPHELSWLRFFRYASVILIVVLGGLAFSKFYPPARNGHLLRMAKVFVKNADLRSATLCLEQILVSEPRNLDATLMMAELSEANRSPQTLVWRKRVVQIAPESFRYRIDWIKAALKMGEITLAAEGLATVDEAGRRTAAFHHLAASIAIAWNNLPEAERHAALALQKEPDNDGYKFNAALIWMQADDTERRQKGREMMLGMADHSEFRYRALRAMANEAIRKKDWKEAATHSWSVQAEPQSTFEDRISHLDLLEETKDPKRNEFLASVQTLVAENADATVSVTMWMIKSGMAREALGWLESLPGGMQIKAPVRMAQAEALSALEDWPGLQRSLEIADWRNFEFLRQAYFARMARALGQQEAFASHWDAAILGAARNTGPLSLLNRLAREWGWQKESDALLWDVAASGANNRWALEALYDKYEKAGDSRSLYQVVLRMLEIKPDDVMARNNFALLSLLLNIRVDQAHATSRKLYSEFSGSPVVVSTYAYSLLLQGKPQAAVNVFKALPEEQLSDPAVAAYYGIVLAGNGERERAMKYFELAKPARLLPEEWALIPGDPP